MKGGKKRSAGFNLVIENLLISSQVRTPDRPRDTPGFQSRNRESSNFKETALTDHITKITKFQSRNRESSNFKFPRSTDPRTKMIVSIS